MELPGLDTRINWLTLLKLNETKTSPKKGRGTIKIDQNLANTEKFTTKGLDLKK